METYLKNATIRFDGMSQRSIDMETVVSTFTVGELRSNLSTKTPLYVRSGSYIKQIPLEHLSYIKERSWNISGGI